MRSARWGAISSPRGFSAAAGGKELLFDAETAAIYARIAEQHFHENGPWPAMRSIIGDKMSGKDAAFILDLATGPGQPGICIAEANPSMSIILSDNNEDMLAKATAGSAHLSNVKTVKADMDETLPFEDGSFDAVTCCYGYMFPDDKAKAVAESFRVLKPGGILVAATWDRMDMLPMLRDIMTDVLGFQPPPPPLNPMSLAEPGMFEKMVADAGFSVVSVKASTYPFDLGKDIDYQFKVATILMKDKINELGAEDKAKAAFHEHNHKYTTVKEDGTMLLPTNTFKLTVAAKPI